MNLKETLASLGLTADDGEFRFQVINITVPNPTVANQLVQQNAALDRDFNRIVGIAYFEITSGGVSANYLVGAATNRKQWIDDIIIGAWVAANVGPNEKFFRVNIPYGSGDSFYARVTPNALTSAAFTGQMVLILKKDLTEMPKV